METNFNFKSQVCTTKEQSERLLALGLKKETADMYYRFYDENTYEINPTWETIWEDRKDYKKIIPAWSLHRLIELAYGNWKEGIVPVYLGNSYDMLIGSIEFQVKQGKFNKEYLV